MSKKWTSTFIIISFLTVFQSGCGGGFTPKGIRTSSSIFPPRQETWNFLTPSNYIFDDEKVEIVGGQVRLKNQSYLLDTAGEFLTGTQVATTYAAGALTIDAGSATNELTAETSPYYDRLVGLWNFESNFNDSSSEVNNASGNGGISGDTTVYKVGSESLFLDGTDDFLNIPDSESLDADLGNQLSVSYWVKTSGSAINSKHVSKGCYDGAAWLDASYQLTSTNTGQVQFTISNNGSSLVGVLSTEILRPGLWYHIVGTYNGTNLRIYVNGNESNSASASGDIFDGTSDLLIGARTGGAACDTPTQFFEGHIDDVAIWKQGLRAIDAKIIYNLQKQKYYGVFESEVIDSGSSLSPWPGLDWVTDIPYLKEMTGDNDGIGLPNSESSSQYPAIVGSNGSTSDNNNMSGLILLLRMNSLTGGFAGAADEINDESNTGNNANVVGGSLTTESSVFFQSVYIDGTSKYINVPNFKSNSNFTDDKSLSLWVMVDPEQVNTSASTNTIIIDGDGTRTFKIGFHNETALPADQGKIFIEATDGSVTVRQTSVNRVDDGNVHHIAVTQDSGTLKLYINGKLDSSIINSTVGAYVGAYTFKVGNSVNNISATVDELALWKRALHPAEVLQVYQRGANRVSFCVRSCIDPNCECRAYGPGGSATDCDGDGVLNAIDSTDNFAASYVGAGQYVLSELQNNTSIATSGQGIGSVKSLQPEISFADLSVTGVNVPNNRYFQFRSEFESSDLKNACSGSVCLPKLTSVAVESNSFFGGPQMITSNLTFLYTTTLTDIEFDQVGSTNCNFSYQLSNDGGTSWYYYNTGNSSWSLASTETSNMSELRSGVSTFHTVPGTGNLAFRAFIQSLDTETDCRLNQAYVRFSD